MGSVIAKTNVKREDGYLYFINKNGDVARVKMARGGKKKGAKGKQEVVAKANVKKQKGFLYYVDKKGNVCQAKMARGR